MAFQASSGVDLILAFMEHIYGIEQVKPLVDALEHDRVGICYDPYAKLYRVEPTWTCVDTTPKN